MSIYGIRGQALSWFQSYLDNRQQFVTYNNVRSVVEKVKCWVPQGSILGPLLFLLYINDLANVCSKSFPILFADGTNLFFHSEDLSNIEITLSEEFAGISQWLKVSRLSLNTKKTKYVIFTRKDRNAKIHLQIDNQEIFETKASKLIGVFIDDKLNWKIHLAYISGK